MRRPTRSLPPLSALAVATASLVLAACGSSGGDDATTAKKTTTTAAAPTMRVIYATPTTEDEKVAQTLLSAGGTAEVAKGLAKDFKLPWDTKVVVRTTSDTGPQYRPDDHTINLDYAFVDFILKQVKANDPKITDYDLGKSVAAINSFIFVHEFAHLLIDAFDLPITGREEDAADELATVFMTEFVKGGEEYAFDAADFFQSLQRNPSDLQDADFFDEHSLDAQRAYAIACWVAGADEEYYEAIEKAGLLDADRLARCPSEYQQKVKAWQTLLKPYLVSTQAAKKS